MFKFLAKINGFKRIIAYLGINLLPEHSILINSMQSLIENPQDPQNIGNFVLNAFLLFGMVDGARKEIKLRTNR